MPGKRLLVFLLLLGLLASGCASELKTGDLNDEDVESGRNPGTQIMEPGKEEEDPQMEEERDNIREEPIQDGSISKPESLCEDPFDGMQPAFDTAYWEKTNFCKHSVEYGTIFSGGPPPDGIPPIDVPGFVSTKAADEWLRDREPVITFGIDQDRRAYPLQIMTWHEIVNDTVAGVPVVITFCPLCNAALVFGRPTVDGQTLTFGTSGNLRNSDLVMYDRQTESWWQQFTGEAIVGDLTGMELQALPAAIISWEDFKSYYPEGKVLSRDTGYTRRYGSNPYVGYDNIDSSPFLFEAEVDDRLRPMARVVGVDGGQGQAIGVSYQRLKEEMVIQDILGGTPIVLFWKEGTASALDASSIPEGKDVGTTGVFEAVKAGQTLTFTPNGDGTYKDKETNSTWNILGQAIEGDLAGEHLTPLPHVDTFWFVWAVFKGPESLVK